MAAETVDELKQRIVHLESELRAVLAKEPDSLTARVARSRRTRLISIAGDSCDYIERLACKVTVKELREKITESKGINVKRVLIHRQDGSQPLVDDEEIHPEASCVHSNASDSRWELRSVGEPLQLVLLAAVQNTFSGKVKCHLKHADEYTTFEEKDWDDEWVELFLEVKDLGPRRNAQLRIFIGDADLVCYGELEDPGVRQIETWGNKCAGSLTLEIPKVKKKQKSQPSVGLTSENKPFQVLLCRRYMVERGSLKYDCDDESTIRFEDKQARDAFIAAFRAWEHDYE